MKGKEGGKYDDKKIFTWAGKVQSSSYPPFDFAQDRTPAVIRVLRFREKTWIPVYTGMTKHPRRLLADSFNACLGVQGFKF